MQVPSLRQSLERANPVTCLLHFLMEFPYNIVTCQSSLWANDAGYCMLGQTWKSVHLDFPRGVSDVIPERCFAIFCMVFSIQMVVRDNSALVHLGTQSIFVYTYRCNNANPYEFVLNELNIWLGEFACVMYFSMFFA